MVTGQIGSLLPIKINKYISKKNLYHNLERDKRLNKTPPLCVQIIFIGHISENVNGPFRKGKKERKESTSRLRELTKRKHDLQTLCSFFTKYSYSKIRVTQKNRHKFQR